MKRLWLLAAFLALGPIARAQQVPATANLTAQDSGACTTANACLSVNIPVNGASAVVQLSGNWTATIQFEASTGSGPNGSPFTAINGTPVGGSGAVSSATTNGAWRFNVSAVYVIRVRVSSFSSGPVQAAITASQASSFSSTTFAPSSGTIGGGGVACAIPIFTDGTDIGISNATDCGNIFNSADPVDQPLSLYNCKNSASGTTAGLLVTRDANGNCINLPNAQLTKIVGICYSGCGTSGTALICKIGTCPATLDNTSVIDDCIVASTANAQGHDAGATCPTGVQQIGIAQNVNGGTGTNANVDVFISDFVPNPTGPVQTIQVGGTTLAGTQANLNNTTPAAQSNFLNCFFQTDNGSPLSNVSLECPEATTSQLGFVELAQDLCGTDVAPVVCGIQQKPVTFSGIAANDVICFPTTSTLANCHQGVPIRTVSGNSDTILSSDRLTDVRYTAASGATAVTLPQAGSTGFASNITMVLTNAQGSGTVTVTPTTSTINGSSTLGIAVGNYCFIYSDNTNYFANCGTTSGGSVTAVTASGFLASSGGTTPNITVAHAQGTDTNLMTAGTVSGTGSTLCTDANGGATTSGCSSGGVTSVTATAPIHSSGGTTPNITATISGNTTTLASAGTLTGTGLVCDDGSGNMTTNGCLGGIGPIPVFGVTPLADQNYTVQAGDDKHLLTITPTATRTITLPQPGTLSVNPLSSSTSVGATTTSPITQAVTTASGNVIVVEAVGDNFSATTPTFSTPTDTGGDTFTQTQASQCAGTSVNAPIVCIQQWYAVTTFAGSNTISMAFGSGAGQAVRMQIYVLQDINSLDGTPTQYSNLSGFPTNPQITTNAQNDMVINFLQPGGSGPCSVQPGNPSGFTTLFSNTLVFNQSSYAVLPTASTYTLTPASGTCTGAVVQQITAFSTTAKVSFANGFSFSFRNSGAAPVTFTPTSSELSTNWFNSITSGASFTVYPGQTGVFYSDGTNWQATIANSGVNGNVTPVTVNANVSTDQNLMSTTIKANSLNHALNSLHVFGGGTYTTVAANTSTITVKVKLGSTTLGTFTSQANIGGQTNDVWNIDFYFTSTTTGSSDTFKAHGTMIINGITSGIASAYTDANTGSTGSVDVTADETLQITIAFSSASASNSGTEDQLIVTQVN